MKRLMEQAPLFPWFQWTPVRPRQTKRWRLPKRLILPQWSPIQIQHMVSRGIVARSLKALRCPHHQPLGLADL